MNTAEKSGDYDLSEMIPMHVLPLGEWYWPNFTSHSPLLKSGMKIFSLKDWRLKVIVISKKSTEAIEKKGDIGTGCLEKLCHPWKYGRSDWSDSEQPDLVSGRYSCPWQGTWTRWSLVWILTQAFLWLYDTATGEVHVWLKMTSTCLQMKLARLWDEAKWLQSSFNTLTLRSIQLPKSPSLMLFKMAKVTKEV